MFFWRFFDECKGRVENHGQQWNCYSQRVSYRIVTRNIFYGTWKKYV